MGGRPLLASRREGAQMTRPLLNRRLTGMGTTIFAEMSALAVATGSINLGQGFPDTDGPAEIAEAAVDADPGRRATSTRPGPASRSCGRRSPSTSSASTGWRSTRTPRCSSPPAPPRRSRRPCSRCCEPGDEVIAFEPYYDSYAASIAMAGATRGAGDAAAAGLPARPGRAARRGHQPDPADPAQHPAQPDRHGAHPGRADARSPRLAVEHDLHRGHRRGLRAPRLRRASTSRSRRCRAWPSAR